MAVADFNVGSDVTLDIIDPNFGEIRIPIITGFDKNPRNQELESRPISGVLLFASLPDGWEGTLDIDRADNVLDAWYAEREARYFRGELLPNVSITEMIRERDGSISEYRYENVSMTLASAGQSRGNEKITQRVTWRASRRVRV